MALGYLIPAAVNPDDALSAGFSRLQAGYSKMGIGWSAGRPWWAHMARLLA